jgi:hypothetical protein
VVDGSNMTWFKAEGQVGMPLWRPDNEDDARTRYRLTREFVMERLVGKTGGIRGNNNLLQLEVRQRRKELLNINDGDEEKDESRWKIVGMSQRSQRRRWQNLDEVIEDCNRRYRTKGIICVETNLEIRDMDPPMQHLLAHASLDVLIGIHGASIIEGILMRDDSIMVEMLPFLPDDLTKPNPPWGHWTRWTSRFTPVGDVFSFSPINLVGYPLKRQSSTVDTCHGANWTKECMGRYTWSNRDFFVSIDEVRQMIDRFVVNNLDLCQDWQQQAADDFVLYNINCRPGNGTDVGAKGNFQFFSEPGWVENKTKWTMEDAMNEILTS